MGVVYFGLQALAVIAVSIFCSIAFELLYEVIMGKKLLDAINALDYSSLVTGIIIALILPATWHLYVPALASAFAIIVVKMLFGGTGKNLVNPAVTGRIFAFISFTTIMNAFIAPNIGTIVDDKIITGATSLQSILNDGSSLSVIDLLLGTGIAGCIGETCKIAILVGAIYLAIKGIIDILMPTVAVLIAGLMAVMLNDFDFGVFLPTILSGGLIFGAYFMATDFVTNPTSKLGQYVFFIGFGILTGILRHFTGYETTSFAILIMNLLVPLIDKVTIGKPFGYKKAKGAK
jgi:electron transport complex protein RnfD